MKKMSHDDTTLKASCAPNEIRTSSVTENARCPRRQKRRSCSLPRIRGLQLDQDYDNADRLCRMRSFRTTKEGVVNNGDSFRQESSSSLMSSGSTVILDDGRRKPSTSSNCSDNACVSGSRRSSEVKSYYRVAFLGGSGVGKTSVIEHCLSSEPNSGSSNNVGKDGHDDTGTSTFVLLDDEEYLIELIDNTTVGQCKDVHVDAYVVVFAVTDTSSFKEAAALLRLLRLERGCDRTVILVANKVDLVRQRRVDTEDIRCIATRFDCKCVEVSAALNHNIDNLIVGVIKQIRFKLRPPNTSDPSSGVGVGRDGHTDRKKMNILAFLVNRLFIHTRDICKVRIRSCENLLR